MTNTNSTDTFAPEGAATTTETPAAAAPEGEPKQASRGKRGGKKSRPNSRWRMDKKKDSEPRGRFRREFVERSEEYLVFEPSTDPKLPPEKFKRACQAWFNSPFGEIRAEPKLGFFPDLSGKRGYLCICVTYRLTYENGDVRYYAYALPKKWYWVDEMQALMDYVPKEGEEKPSLDFYPVDIMEHIPTASLSMILKFEQGFNRVIARDMATGKWVVADDRWARKHPEIIGQTLRANVRMDDNGTRVATGFQLLQKAPTADKAKKQDASKPVAPVDASAALAAIFAGTVKGAVEQPATPAQAEAPPAEVRDETPITATEAQAAADATAIAATEDELDQILVEPASGSERVADANALVHRSHYDKDDMNVVQGAGGIELNVNPLETLGFPEGSEPTEEEIHAALKAAAITHPDRAADVSRSNATNTFDAAQKAADRLLRDIAEREKAALRLLGFTVEEDPSATQYFPSVAEIADSAAMRAKRPNQEEIQKAAATLTAKAEKLARKLAKEQQEDYAAMISGLDIK